MTSRPVACLDTPCYILSADQNRVVAKVLDGLEYSSQKRSEMGADEAVHIVGVYALGHNDVCVISTTHFEC